MGDHGEIPETLFQGENMTAFAAFVAIEEFFRLIDIEMVGACLAQRALINAIFAVLEFEGPTF